MENGIKGFLNQPPQFFSFFPTKKDLYQRGNHVFASYDAQFEERNSDLQNENYFCGSLALFFHFIYIWRTTFEHFLHFVPVFIV